MNLIDKIEAHNFYTGEKAPYTFSVTEVSDNEPLKGYLARKYEPKRKKVGQHTLGQIFDVGIRALAIEGVFGDNVLSGSRLLKQLPNGMFLTGEPDIIDNENEVIYDVKLTKVFAYEQILKEKANHNYFKQLNYYRMMLGSGNYSMKLFVAMKDQSDAKENHPDAIEIINVERIGNSILIEKATEYAENVTAILEGRAKAPDKCTERFGYDMKCKHYCDYNHVCPYGKKYYSPMSEWL